MKKILSYISAVAVIIFTFSCEDNIDTTPNYERLASDFTVTPSATSVTMTIENQKDSVIAFDWTDPGYTVGLENTTFTIRLAPEGTDFARYQSKSYTGVLKGYLVGEELNGMALALGALVGEENTFDVVVQASHDNSEVIMSEVMSITVTPYAMLAIVPSATNVETTFETRNNVGLTLNWNEAFDGFSGPATYQIEYAKGGTDFANATVAPVTSFEYEFTEKTLRDLVMTEYAGVAGVATAVEFRVKAVNEFGNEEYSNVVSVDITPYDSPGSLYPAIGILGSSIGSWDDDIDLYNLGGEEIDKWYVSLYLNTGEVKFRANDSWSINWGSASYPTGTGTQNGSNVPIASAGYYQVEFNAATGEYAFTQITVPTITSVGLIGPAAIPGNGGDADWGAADINLTQDGTNPYVWTGTVPLEVGEFKFRADDDWAVNWGVHKLTTPLSGFGQQGGSNLTVQTAGTYFVYINIATGEYFLGKDDRATPYNDIGVIGTATADDWNSDTNLVKNVRNAYKWSGSMVLTAEEAKFRADNDWAVNWGSADFPAGIGTSGGANIPVDEAGTYWIYFNTATGEYRFIKQL